MTEKTTKLRGFAAMSPERRTEIARKGGASIPAEKRHFSRNPDSAREAGRIGGAKSRKGPKGYRGADAD